MKLSLIMIWGFITPFIISVVTKHFNVVGWEYVGEHWVTYLIACLMIFLFIGLNYACYKIVDS